MAAGDVIVFIQGEIDKDSGLLNLASTTEWKLALLTDSVTPVATETTPRFGAGGSTNYALTECSAGGNYPAGGVDINNNSVARDGSEIVFDDTGEVLIAANPANPTDARWGILYNTASANRCYLFVDLGAVRDLTAGLLRIVWNTNGITRTSFA